MEHLQTAWTLAKYAALLLAMASATVGPCLWADRLQDRWRVPVWAAVLCGSLWFCFMAGIMVSLLIHLAQGAAPTDCLCQ